MTGYYDYVLALIPGVLVGVTAMLTLFGTPLWAALFAGAGASSFVVCHAVFVRAPVEEPAAEAAQSAVEASTRSEPASRAD
ncbi:hypothetical protein B4589_014670 [Halolamina sp. CBA1230]|uniref:hypothetical protein n=1 Tax=Halolamina sp. CBA1230 TaxID=1853690 RepID=UPI0009A1C1FF|nr:hypothetical protein [Halolamina sp. CBA1230]QKY21556.1 hypothetical protein B4589_014670 [Halolamina sp. CBA1230]